MNKVSITFQPMNLTINSSSEVTIMDAARQAGLTIDAPCNGKGTCGKCLVRVKGSVHPMDEEEASIIAKGNEELIQEENGINLEERLACKTKIIGPVEVEIKNHSQTFRTVDSGRGNLNTISEKVKLEPREDIITYAEGKPCLGIAVDIGTTSVVAWLFNLRTGEQLAKASCLNPQTQYGGDVITRITYAKKEGGLIDLQKAIIHGINGLIDQLTKESNTSPSNIYHMVVAANTTMLHLLKGENPKSLAVAPYEAVFLEGLEFPAGELNLDMAEKGIVQFTPSASSFVGGDILAGLLAVDFASYNGGALFIDIGTNGELAALHKGQIVATSTAAGPALEGMNITFGCRAENGAIEGVNIDEKGNISLEIIGQEKSKGLCGSGLIELTSELLRNRVILPNGRFGKQENLLSALAERLVEWQGQKAFLVDEESGIVLTQKDIRQIQLAKGAILAGVTLLIKELGLPFEEIDQVYIAGAFGYHLKPKALVSIGIIPEELIDKLEFVGNTAIEGGAIALLNYQAGESLKELQKKVLVHELSIKADFQDAFIKSLNFPDKR